MSWQSRTADLKEKIRHLMNSKEMSDVTVIVGNEKRRFYTHKWLLSMYSEEFYDMFYGPLSSASKEINLSSDDVQIFDIFIRYIYSDELKIKSSEEAFSVLIFADKYRVNQLKNKCIQFIAGSVPSNIISELFEASASLTPRSWRKSSASEGDNTFEGNSSEVKKSSTEHLTQSLPAMNQNVHCSNRNSLRSVESMNEFSEDLTRSPSMNESDYPINEDSFQKTQKKNSNSEVDLNSALKQWGWLQLQQQIGIEKFHQVLEDELNELKAKRSEDFYALQQNLKSLLNFPSNCSKNFVFSTSFPYLEECFRSRELDLYVYGVTLNLKFNSTDHLKETPIVKLKISNLTKKVKASKKISIFLDGSDRIISLKLLYPIFVGKDEVCEIVLKSDSKIENGKYVYCGELCCLDQRLDRLQKFSADIENRGHFNSIIALLP